MDGRNSSVAWVVAVLVLSSAWIVAVRLWTVGEPLDRDAATYAVAGREMLAGRVLYRDVFDHKPPGVHLSFMVAQAMGGSTEETVVVLGFLTALATMVGVFVVARRIAGNSGAGAAAALFWAITSATLGLQANQLNTEAFVNLFVVWAVAMLVECPPRGASFLAAGVLLGCASLYKTVVAAQAVALVFAVILGGPGRVGERVGKASVMAAGGLAPWLITVAAFAALGAFREMVFAVFGYNTLYAGDQVANILHGLSPALMAPSVLLPLLPIAGVTMLLPLKWPRPIALPDLVLVAWLLSVPVAIAWPGRYAPHYYQFWLPVLPVVAAVVLWRVSTRPARLAVGVTLALVGLQAPALTLGPEACSLRKYGPVFLEARELGREIRRNLGDRASFWEWGAETSLYFYSGVSPPTRFFYNYPLEVVPEWYTEVVTREVTQADPELVVVYRREMLMMPPGLAAWLHRGYERFIADEAWELWRRKERGADEGEASGLS